MIWTSSQRDLFDLAPNRHVFLKGPAGSGKTSAATQVLIDLLSTGVPGSSVLLLVPQRTLAGPYQSVLRAPQTVPGGQVDVLTMGGLARRMVDLFWPLIASDAGFTHPTSPPTFLTLETAQYYMAHLVRPYLDQGFFESISIDRNRLYSQLLDNLNKAAIVGFPITEIGERLKGAWSGESSQMRVYDDVQVCANHFRRYCLENNLLDFSLQMECFRERLWPSLLCRTYLKSTYRHLIVDNVEEDTPVAHDILSEWLPDFDSALLLYDEDAGYRSYLGADPASALGLRAACTDEVRFQNPLVISPSLEALGLRLGRALDQVEALPAGLPDGLDSLDYPTQPLRFFPQMLDWVVDQIIQLIQEGTPPGEIAVLAPVLPDSLRFALANRLDERGIPYRSHRPSRALSDEPTARCLLSLAELAHPGWGHSPSRVEITYALLQAIRGLDLTRAHLLTEICCRMKEGRLAFDSFSRLRPDAQARITYSVGERYEFLRTWLENYMASPEPEVDYFFSRLFGEVLSQPGFGFHDNLDAGQIAANLVESAQKFRWAIESRNEPADRSLGQEYIEMVRDGVIAAQYIGSWNSPDADAVFIAPAYTFLMNNRPVNHQFWLDSSSNAWFERLYQPLTHPYVLSRAWVPGRQWTASEEYEANRATLFRLVLGLLRRCRVAIHLGLSDLNEGGYEQRGLLLKAFYQAQLSAEQGVQHG
jgi:hypothetical protein